MVHIRPATPDDSSLIRRTVHAERLDPTGLHWRHFLIAEADGEIAGIGQVREHGPVKELGSLVVLPLFRGRGIARLLIAALEARAGLPLYLFCRAELGPFYNRFGYRQIPVRETPGRLRLKALPAVLLRLFGLQVIVMVKDSPLQEPNANGGDGWRERRP